METTISQLLYLISLVLFIVGLKGLSHPETARRGNLIAASGMILGIIVALFQPMQDASNNYLWILGGVIVGSAIGLTAAKKVQMTKMPEMVSLFNGLGGACAMFIGFVEFYNLPAQTEMMSGSVFTNIFALVIGSISFSGSLIAYGKLNGSLRDSLKLPAPQVINVLNLIGIFVICGLILSGSELDMNLVIALFALSLTYGVVFVTPIGGGDMPVVISLLNSITGIGAMGAGLIYSNNVMIIGGILVGASGVILTVMMCKAMNRTLFNVIIGGISSSSSSAAAEGDQVIKEVQVSDLAIQLKYASKVIVVPGYGLAVAQAQHTIHELEVLLEEEGVDFKFAIHPVAGRMPGHMNVLLAEADVSYDKLLELDQANSEFPTTDVVLVIGANDVVNPAAKTDTSSPIYGMPILDVELAKQVVVMKRGMSKGYAGIENPLFFNDNTKMLFGDAKQSIAKLKEEVQNA
ncbi:NAD(P)(+) transhydrogenase (Re/Si-specific) subunit beta [Aureibacter tunicatorum]|uniref:NAD(P) transhydrogenase subunit beta n=1 Tax=Aureibacter tunicatorum TaxID=866807 RepID=A0AAE4BNS7_9BACT|nr:NAD(P)(+) transhydrogenase (Re/Si-specific) subunit beta [Aureibacter tunicatorum]MDR6237159.1 NAD(P) transhydrogenase subunit beta [Aureibacter tunicatorum]BDD06151.1 NAD(P) transhydrogenase subunit beta [Aureibacter tunicatorum]